MNKVFQRLVRLQNPLMTWMLRSPLHVFVSGQFMLITVTGRKTGHIYEIPVQYRQEGQTLWVVTNQAYRWWHNVRGGGPVKVRLRGKEYDGCATPSVDKAAVALALKKLYPSSGMADSPTMLETCVALEVHLQS